LNYYNYFTEIEETFVRRRGKNLMLSPLDWALIESWQEREVPLHIVLRGIEKVFDTFDKQPDRKRSVKSLSYCKEEIEAQFAEWLEMQIGKNGTATENDGLAPETNGGANGEHSTGLFPDEAVADHLAEVGAALKTAMRAAGGDLFETLERVSLRLADLGKNYESAETLEQSLEKLDALIDEALLEAPATADSRREIEKQLDSYQHKMEGEVFRRTVDLMLLKKLRETAKIPRLSLFYL
jgi:hypothetical protein